MSTFQKTNDVIHATTHTDDISATRRWMSFASDHYRVNLELITYERSNPEAEPLKPSWLMSVDRGPKANRYLPYLSVTSVEDENGYLPADIRVQTTSYGAVTLPEAKELLVAMTVAVEEVSAIYAQFINPINNGVGPNDLPWNKG